jgi:hypothetical protein
MSIRTQNAVIDKAGWQSQKHWCKLKVNTKKHEDLNLVFANHVAGDKICPLTTIEIAKAQDKDQEIKIY